MNKPSPDFSHAPTNKVEAFRFPPQNGDQSPRDVYAIFNDLLDMNAIVVIIQFKKLRFGVRHFFPVNNGWLECAVDDPEIGPGDDIRILIKEGLPMIVYVGQVPFTN